jgi:hypothetical protein
VVEPDVLLVAEQRAEVLGGSCAETKERIDDAGYENAPNEAGRKIKRRQ